MDKPIFLRASLMTQWVKNLLAMQETPETRVGSLGWQDPLEKEMAIHSSIIGLGNPTDREEPTVQRLQSQGS